MRRMQMTIAVLLVLVYSLNLRGQPMGGVGVRRAEPRRQATNVCTRVMRLWRTIVQAGPPGDSLMA
jgi:hypothetical protein